MIIGKSLIFSLKSQSFLIYCFIHQNFLILVITFVPCPQLGSAMEEKDEMFKYKTKYSEPILIME